MPKIIENVREQLVSETKKQIAENGYARTTIRSVATACGLGVGTVYNYFKSKDMLIATFMLEDWQRCIETIRNCKSSDVEQVLRRIFNGLIAFSDAHHTLFCDEDAAKVFATVFSEKHKIIRRQLAEIIKPFCEESSVEDADYLSEFIVESLLTWTFAGKSFDEQYNIIWKLLK